MRKRYLVDLTEEERAELRALCVRRDVRPSTRRKAEALLQVDAGKTDKQIAQALGVSGPTVARYRQRFFQAGSLAAYSRAGELPLTLTVEAYHAGSADRRRRRIQALARRAKPLHHPGTYVPPGRGHKVPPEKRSVAGNRSDYLANRIARDRPDVLERMKRGEFTSMRDAAWAAGIRSVWRGDPPDTLPVTPSHGDGNT
ncbi:MAG: helix-turn-helix domain-containing protein [Candidatus Tectomicrobia bacterium]|nr:helix-turn-helix domain-containing protein [Candidatus Tectomicrobia bacterium]